MPLPYSVGPLYDRIHGLAERVTAARQAGHDGSDRDVQRVSQFLVRQTIQLASGEQCARANRQPAHREFDHPHVIGAQQQRFRIRGRPDEAVLFLVELVGDQLCAAMDPVPARVADDAEEPGSAVAAGKCLKVSKGS